MLRAELLRTGICGGSSHTLRKRIRIGGRGSEGITAIRRMSAATSWRTRWREIRGWLITGNDHAEGSQSEKRNMDQWTNKGKWPLRSQHTCLPIGRDENSPAGKRVGDHITFLALCLKQHPLFSSQGVFQKPWPLFPDSSMLDWPFWDSPISDSSDKRFQVFSLLESDLGVVLSGYFSK
jgi:hypothetical protein